MVFGRKKNRSELAARHSGETDRTPSEEEKAVDGHPTKAQVKRATRTRKIFCLLTSFLLLIAVIFLILVEVGNISVGSSFANSTYFIRLDLTNIIPQSVPNAVLVNSIARTLGLHDFYQVGLWNFCEGYNDQGVTACSAPKTLYWFNPVEIIVNELLAGATIALPTDVTDILDIIRLASNWMFGLFLSGAVLAFVMIFVAPLALFSRWIALFTSIFTFLAALFITVASVIATVMFVIMRNAFTSVADLNITSELGTKMFVFMYIACAASILAALIQIGECCCCASRRDVKTGRKKGSKKAWSGSFGNREVTEMTAPDTSDAEKPKKRGLFGRKK
ncbi:putative SUR7/PalI family protein [Elsinoe australis]|uniref:Putative SUR7/PalI family protein n=1 Tax=Elsinoe australis TaxID=40998 RepID=A0A4U7AUM1_9PEZI|nr:putative SUR7/PalI family protein [Elsinoe australis]